MGLPECFSSFAVPGDVGVAMVTVMLLQVHFRSLKQQIQSWICGRGVRCIENVLGILVFLKNAVIELIIFLLLSGLFGVPRPGV